MIGHEKMDHFAKTDNFQASHKLYSPFIGTPALKSNIRNVATCMFLAKMGRLQSEV